MDLARLIVAAGAVVMWVGVPSGADGSEPGRLDCGFEVHLTFTPGISPTVEKIRITSTEPGLLVCTGTWSARQPTGRGLVTFAGDAVGSCAGSTIDGVVRMHHPLVAGGHFDIVIPVHSGRVGTVLHATAQDPTRPAAVLGTGTPDPGQDCTTVPITGIAARGRAIVGQPSR